jgi:hypothetical protein
MLIVVGFLASVILFLLGLYLIHLRELDQIKAKASDFSGLGAPGDAWVAYSAL